MKKDLHSNVMTLTQLLIESNLVSFSITIIFLIFEIVFEIIPFLSIIFYRIISIFLILFNFNFRMNKLITQTEYFN